MHSTEMFLTGTLLVLAHMAVAQTQQHHPQNLVNFEQSILEKLLNRSNYLAAEYEKPTRPLPEDDCDTVTRIDVNMFIRSFDFVDDDRMEYRVQLTFRQEWVDSRLKFSEMDEEGKLKYLTLINSSQIWTPDTYFVNGGTANFHNFMRPNGFVRVFADGSVLSSARISTIASCAMSLKSFPMDEQTCFLKVSSYGYTKDDVVYSWKPESPIQLTPTLDLARFTVGNFETFSEEDIEEGSSTITLKFGLKRDIGFYKSQIFVPCIMLVTLGWFSLWVSRFEAASRSVVIMGAVLATTIVVTSFNSSLPKVSYLKASDIWIVTCALTIYSALVEYVLVQYLTASNVRCWKFGYKSGIRLEVLRKICEWLFNTSPGGLIDFFSRITYPLVFLVVCIIFWRTY